MDERGSGQAAFGISVLAVTLPPRRTPAAARFAPEKTGVHGR
jgi:hypothetical protein